MLNILNVILYCLTRGPFMLKNFNKYRHSLEEKNKFKKTRKESFPRNFAHENCDFRDQNLRHGENGDRGRSLIYAEDSEVSKDK